MKITMRTNCMIGHDGTCYCLKANHSYDLPRELAEKLLTPNRRSFADAEKYTTGAIDDELCLEKETRDYILYNDGSKLDLATGHRLFLNGDILYKDGHKYTAPKNAIEH